MTRKLGIPRGLFFYKYHVLWKTFFEALGVEVVVSPPTNRAILDRGVKWCVDEACLPVKIFHGHVLELKDRVDALFIPRFTSISRGEYICPKFGGLPDMIRSTFPQLPTIIDVEVNLRNTSHNSFDSALQAGLYFNSSEKEIRKAYNRAMHAHTQYEKKIFNGMLPSDLLESKEVKGAYGKDLTIAVIGHPYNLYDSYLNMNLIQKLRAAGANVITIDMVENHNIQEEVRRLPKRIFWNFGTKAVGTALHLCHREDIAGMIYVMSFGCGVDSFMCDYVERSIRNKGAIPFTVLTMDEHSGEAGLDTRVEAFMDMIRWRSKNETDVSAYG